MTPRGWREKGESPTQGWLVDYYPDYDRDSIVLWLRTRRGVHRIEDDRFRATFYAHAPPAELRDLRRRIGILDGVRDVRQTLGRIDLGTDARVPVLEVHPRRYRDIREVARILDSAGGYYDVRLYNVDLRFSQRYCAAHRIFPFGLLHYANGTWRAEEDPFALDYPLPPFASARLDLNVDAPLGIPRMTDALVGARVGDVALGGSEEDVVRGIGEAVASLDPDVLVTDGGDAFAMPYLARKAAELGVPLILGRDPDPMRQRDGRSYFTYGKIVYKPGQHLLKGRIHLDSGHFAYRESDLAGLAELSRLSTLTPQEQSRLTPGTAISAMETNLALRDGALVLWKKNVPEAFKTSEDLILGDRGGFIFEPEVGVHDGLYELDFASLYPNIMDRYNISLETWNCPCCEETGIRVPGLPYHFCVERRGVVPRTIKPLIDRRRYYKRMKKEPGPNREIYEGRDVILKWTLVTSFGFLGYKNARFGRIECHEAINAYARDILLRTMEIAESHGYDVVHGIVDSVWLRARPGADDIRTVVDRISDATGMPIELEGRYRWIVFLPSKTTGVGALNRYYGLFEDGAFKLRGIELRRHDTPDVVNVMQEAMLAELGQAGSRTAFLERVPRAVTALRWTAKQIREGRVPLHAFVLTKSVTKRPEEYAVLTATAAALAQLKAKGFEVEPGESVRYVVLDMASRNAACKVRPAEFLQGDERPDAEAYVRLACRAGETLLAPFGYTEDRLVAMCRDLSDLDRVEMPASAIRVQEDYKSYGHSRARGGVGYRPTWSPDSAGT